MTTSEQPSCLLTIVMPAYNAAKYLDITLESFLKQRFTSWKLIVIDDCSKDNTWEIIENWQQNDSRIIGVRNDVNLKVARTMNKGIALVDTPFFARVDSDDVLLPDHFLKTINFLDQHADIDICGSQVITIDGNGQFRRKWNYETSSDWIKMSSIFACPFLQSSVVMRAKAIKANGYRPEMELVEDYELWIRLLRTHKAANIPDYTIQYRIHDSNMSEVNKSKLLILLETLFTEYKNDYPIALNKLSLHARMEVGDWSNSSMDELALLKKWKKELERIAVSNLKLDKASFRSVTQKYFTNAFLKIATQNSGTLRYKSLVCAIVCSPKFFISIIKRKKENSTLTL